MCSSLISEPIQNLEFVEAEIADYPFIVSIAYFYNDAVEHFCNGVIIDENYVLTTHTCLLYRAPVNGEYRIIAGLRDVRDFNQSVIASFGIAESVSYPTAGFALNDVALLRTDAAITYSDEVQPAILSNFTYNPEAPTTLLSYSFEELYTAAVDIRSDEDCLEDAFDIIVPINPTLHICTVVPGNFTEIQPDVEKEEVKPVQTPRLTLAQCVSAFRSSATPLLQTNAEGETVVVGISSWGVGECNSHTPTISSNIQEYLAFIEEVINRDVDVEV